MLKTVDENLLLFSSKYAGHKEFWENKLKGVTKTEILLNDKWNDAHTGGRENEKIEFPIPRDLVVKIEHLSKNSDLSVYMILLTALKTLLFKYLHNPDPVVLSPVYAPKVTGDTLNPCVFIRETVRGDMTFKELLLNVRQSVLGAYENQDYPSRKLFDSTVISNVVCLLENIHRIGVFEGPFSEIENMLAFSFSYAREEQRLEGHISYRARTFEESYLRQVARHFVRILEKGLENIDTPLNSIFLVSGDEKRQLLTAFNRTEQSGEIPTAGTIPDLWEEQVSRTPHRIAVVYDDMGTGDNSARFVTFGELDRRARQLAGLLREKGVGIGEIVGILTPRSAEMVVAVMGVLKAGGAYMPIDPEYPQERINFMLADSSAGVLVTTRVLAKECKKAGKWNGEIYTIENLLSSPGPLTVPPSASFPLPGPLSPAYLIYTSGTTGRPRGVVLEHRSVVNLVRGLNRRIYSRYREESSGMRVCMLSPYTFDASVKQLFGALLQGHTLYIVPEAFRVDAEGLLRFYRKHEIEISDGTPTHIGLLREVMKGDPRAPRPRVRHYIIGGEALSRETAADFFNCIRGPYPGNTPFVPVITNVYGPTECCVDTTSYTVSEENIRLFTHIPLGRPMPGYRVYILGTGDRPVPAGVAGELCAAGVGTARGYLNAQGLTRVKFTDNPFVPGERMYRTGDLARWMPDGNIAFLGRIDHQVKIRGFRIEPREIESQLLRFSSVKDAVVAAREEKEGDRYLCAYIVPTGPGDFDENELREHLSRELPDYIIPSYFVPIEKIPLSPNGKVDRESLPRPRLRAPEDIVPPRNAVEEKMAGVWAEVLGISKELFGIDSNFFQLGGHSLKATILAAKLHKVFNVKIPLARMFESATIRELSKYIGSAVKDRFVLIEPVEKKDYYALSSAQTRLYIQQQLELNNLTYNMPQVLVLAKIPSKETLESIFRELVRRHESLRTSFEMVNGSPAQRVHDRVEFEMTYHDPGRHPGQGAEAPGEDLKAILRAFIRPFDLSRAPLVRAALIRVGEERHILVTDMHHIISDGVSKKVLMNEFEALLTGSELSPLPLQYKDYSEWQSGFVHSGTVREQEKYWLDRFRGKIPIMNLPADFSHPADSFEGGGFSLPIGAGLSDRIARLALETGMTRYMVILAAFNVLLARYLNREDILVGATVFGRKHADLLNIIGMFVNVLPIRNYPKSAKSFDAFLAEVKKNTTDAYENQDYQYEQLVWELDKRGRGQNRLDANIAFSLKTDEDDADAAGTGDTAVHLPVPDEIAVNVSRFDISLVAVERRKETSLFFEYKRALFKERTIEKMAGHLKNILEEVIASPGIKIGDINMLTPGEKSELVKQVRSRDNIRREGPGPENRPKRVTGKVEFDF